MAADGQHRQRISAVNAIDNEPFPEIEYLHACVGGEGVEIASDAAFLTGCGTIGGCCQPEECSCMHEQVVQSGKVLYDEKGRLQAADGTPIYDIKPYVAYVDSVPDATVDWVPGAPALCPVRWTEQAEADLRERGDGALRELIDQVLAQDPRPPTHKADHRADGRDVDRDYGTALREVDVRWRYDSGIVWVLGISPPP